MSEIRYVQIGGKYKRISVGSNMMINNGNLVFEADTITYNNHIQPNKKLNTKMYENGFKTLGDVIGDLKHRHS